MESSRFEGANGANDRLNETLGMAEKAWNAVARNPQKFATEFVNRQSSPDAQAQRDSKEASVFNELPKDVSQALNKLGITTEGKTIVLPNGKKLTPDANTKGVSLEELKVSGGQDGPMSVKLRTDNFQGSPQYLVFTKADGELRGFFMQDSVTRELRWLRQPTNQSIDSDVGGTNGNRPKSESGINAERIGDAISKTATEILKERGLSWSVNLDGGDGKAGKRYSIQLSTGEVSKFRMPTFSLPEDQARIINEAVDRAIATPKTIIDRYSANSDVTALFQWGPQSKRDFDKIVQNWNSPDGIPAPSVNQVKEMIRNYLALYGKEIPKTFNLTATNANWHPALGIEGTKIRIYNDGKLP